MDGRAGTFRSGLLTTAKSCSDGRGEIGASRGAKFGARILCVMGRGVIGIRFDLGGVGAHGLVSQSVKGASEFL